MHESSPLLNKPLFGGLKRAALHDIKEASADENSNKRSKFTGHSLSSEAGQDQRKKESAMQKRKNIGAESAHVRVTCTCMMLLCLLITNTVQTLNFNTQQAVITIDYNYFNIDS